VPVAETWRGFIDESGDVSPYSGSRYLVVAALMTKEPRAIELHVKRTRVALGQRAMSAELKASAMEESITARLLRSLAAEEIEVIAAVLDKRSILRPPEEPESLYRALLGHVVCLCLKRHSRLQLWLDKRYTNRAARDALEAQLREAVVDIPEQVLLLSQEDSRRQRGLQAADSVCWAFYRKYEHDDPSLVSILENRVVSEERVERRLW